MKKIYLYIFLLIFSNFSYSYAGLEGQGDIKLSKTSVKQLVKYLGTGVHNKNKGASRSGRGISFAVSISGQIAGYVYCPQGKNCRSRESSAAIKSCRKWVKKYLNNKKEKCKIFAHGRKIVWNNEDFTIPHKSTEEDLRKILKNLGFL